MFRLLLLLCFANLANVAEVPKQQVQQQPPKENQSIPESTAAELNELAECYERAVNRSKQLTTLIGKPPYPQWYLDDYVIPRFMSGCQDHTKLIVKGNFSEGYVTYEGYQDLKTGKFIDMSTTCGDYFDGGKDLFIFDYFEAFYNLPHPIYNGIPRFKKIYDQLVVYFSPLAIIGLLLGLSVIRKHTAATDFHPLLKAITISTFLVYATIALCGSHFFGLFIALPLCYIGNVYMSYATQGFADFALFPRTLDLFYVLNQCIQALLFLHLASSLVGATWYRARFGKKSIIRAIAGISAVNVGLFVLHFFSIFYVVAAMINNAYSPERRAIIASIGSICFLAKIALIFFSAGAQILSTGGIYRKIKGAGGASYGDLSHLTHQEQNQKSDVAVFRLLGAILVVNCIGNIIYFGCLVTRLAYDVTPSSPGANVLSTWQWNANIATNVCAAVAFYLHLAAASVYAKQAPKKAWQQNQLLDPVNAADAKGHFQEGNLVKSI